MIVGNVRNRHILVNLRVRGPEGQEGDIEFVLDSGFTGVTTLPLSVCAALGLPFRRLQPAGLADSSPILLEVYEAALLWHGEERAVEVLALDGAPLIGMTLLEESDVRFQGNEGGLVRIAPL